MRAVLVLLIFAVSVFAAIPQIRDYETSLVLTPLYIEYAKVSEETFAREVKALRDRIGDGPNVMLGFATFVTPDYDVTPSLDRSIDSGMLSSTLHEIDLIVDRARTNGIVAHVAFTSGHFKGWNKLREAAIRRDVRNAQWFADGWIGPPQDLSNRRTVPRTVWTTPSSYAKQLRERMEETIRIVSGHLAGKMSAYPRTLVSISGDGEVELSFERTLGEGGSAKQNQIDFYTDYSPFAVAQFRDWLREPRYASDLTPATDDNLDGRTFNRDYGQTFVTVQLVRNLSV